MIPSSITDAERELRRAMEQRQGGDISRCIAAYGEIAGNQIQSLRPGDAIRLQIFEQVLSVLEWARLLLYTRRAGLAQDLRLLRKVNSFLDTTPSAGPRLRLDL